MALLSFVDSTPRAYRLKASNAAPLISTLAGTFPEEAMDWARQATTEQEKRALIELARTWSQAAEENERVFGKPAEEAPKGTPISAA